MNIVKHILLRLRGIRDVAELFLRIVDGRTKVVFAGTKGVQQRVIPTEKDEFSLVNPID